MATSFKTKSKEMFVHENNNINGSSISLKNTLLTYASKSPKAIVMCTQSNFPAQHNKAVNSERIKLIV